MKFLIESAKALESDAAGVTQRIDTLLREVERLTVIRDEFLSNLTEVTEAKAAWVKEKGVPNGVAIPGQGAGPPDV